LEAKRLEKGERGLEIASREWEARENKTHSER